jgi:hypothetical protein
VPRDATGGVLLAVRGGRCLPSRRRGGRTGGAHRTHRTRRAGHDARGRDGRPLPRARRAVARLPSPAWPQEHHRQQRDDHDGQHHPHPDLTRHDQFPPDSPAALPAGQLNTTIDIPGAVDHAGDSPITHITKWPRSYSTGSAVSTRGSAGSTLRR